MAEEDDKQQPPAATEASNTESEPNVQPAPPVPPPSRAELVDKARAFLGSPQVMHEDTFAKRRFLAEKGLNDSEIETLMLEQPPLVPPRTYPQPPPSNIPNLLTGVLRILSWVAGGSAALLLVYFRFIYPRLSQSFQARIALRNHQKDLLTRFTTTLESTRQTQRETFAVLPPPQPYKESPQFAICHTTDEIISLVEASHDIPGPSMLRCAIEELGSKGEKATTDAIFQLLDTKFPWIQSLDEPQNEKSLWDLLSDSPLFERQEADNAHVWKYKPPPMPLPSPLVTSLLSLQTALPKKPPPSTTLQKTLETLSDLTGYIATQTYTPIYYGMPNLTPEEEELRREIRALKGLVLNRRSFMPLRPPPISPPSISRSTP